MYLLYISGLLAIFLGFSGVVLNEQFDYACGFMQIDWCFCCLFVLRNVMLSILCFISFIMFITGFKVNVQRCYILVPISLCFLMIFSFISTHLQLVFQTLFNLVCPCWFDISRPNVDPGTSNGISSDGGEKGEDVDDVFPPPKLPKFHWLYLTIHFPLRVPMACLIAIKAKIWIVADNNFTRYIRDILLKLSDVPYAILTSDARL